MLLLKPLAPFGTIKQNQLIQINNNKREPVLAGDEKKILEPKTVQKELEGEKEREDGQSERDRLMSIKSRLKAWERRGVK